MSGAERAFFGSTTEGVLRHSSASVLVTPAQWSPVRSTVPDLSGTGPVIAAVDFSPAASEAATAACRLASVLRTTLKIVHVVPEPPVLARWRGHAEAAVRDCTEAARSQIEKLAASIACDVPVEVKVEIGAVPNHLADCAASSDAHRPILVLGRRAPGEKGGPPGSTAYRVLMLSKAPVLMYVAE
jgi:nucleotide-binding universal stress UspA family protein